jgi:hypothetical protein
VRGPGATRVLCDEFDVRKDEMVRYGGGCIVVWHCKAGHCASHCEHIGTMCADLVVAPHTHYRFLDLRSHCVIQ